MRVGVGFAAIVALSACSHSDQTNTAPAENAGNRLEAAAIATGVIADPNDTDITGTYQQDTEQICIVPAQHGFRIGVNVDYGDGQQCSGSGTVSKQGETLHVALGTNGACAFDARFGGDRITLPGSLPVACDPLCSGRASLEGVAIDRLSDSVSEASTLRDSHGTPLCAGG